MIQFLKNILAPKKCYGCQKIGKYLCENCEKKIFRHSSLCYVCKQPSRDFLTHFECKKTNIFYDGVFLSYHYKNFPIKKMITQAKFWHTFDVWEEVAEQLFQHHKDFFLAHKHEILIIAPPMYFWKRFLRGYNQSEYIAGHFSKKFGFSQNFNIIKKTKSTSSQSHLTRVQRMENLTNCYKVDQKLSKQIENKIIIVVDDVISTGSTLNEIARQIQKYKPKAVYGVVYASD